MTAFKVIVCLGILLALPIAEFVIGMTHLNTTTCNNSDAVAPVDWLLTSSIVGFIFLALAIMTICLMFESEGCGRLVWYGLRAIGVLWTISWTIVGAVSIWRDNPDCQPQPLHDMMWASVIIHLGVVVWILHNLWTD